MGDREMSNRSYRPAAGTIPEAPGVYRFLDGDDRVIYVGKAKNLRSRVNSYFADITGLHPRTRRMVTSARDVRWTVVATEVEALQLEYLWIKEYDPRFNVRYRDDKSYPMLAVTLNEEYPRLHVYRGPRRRGVRYFGPFAHAWAIRETLDQLLRVFPARTCSAGLFKRHTQIGRPCLLGYIDKCSAPCVGSVSARRHRAIVEDFCEFLSGRTDGMIRRLDREMRAASDALEFERAARLRDDLDALRRAMERQAVVLGDGTDADVVAFAEDELAAAVQVFHVRGGRVRGQRGWVIDKVEEVTTAGLVGQFLTQFYGEQREFAEAEGTAGSPVPREILVPEEPADPAAVTAWLSGLRGSRVEVRVPRRGDKRALADTVRRNAEEAFTQYKLRRAADLTARSEALRELQEALDLDSAPLRIECVDVSHVQGSDVVASLVVFEDGMARKPEYRHFAVRDGAARGDVGSVEEVVRRRFTAMLRERAEPVDGRPRRFAYPPNLLVVDGGAPQVAVAADTLADLGITDVAVIGLAKRLEEVWLPAEPDPVLLPRTSEALYLLQRVRDEAHRFAISYHRRKRSTRVRGSVLDDIAGLGPARRNTLLRHFGSLRRLAEADVGEISAVRGIGPALAEVIHRAVTPGASRPVDHARPPSDGEAVTDQPPPPTGPDGDRHRR